MQNQLLQARWAELGQDILPEEWFLFDLAKVDPSDVDLAHAITLAGDSHFSWTNAWNLATRLWLDGLVARNVRDRPELASLVPRELKPILAMSHFTAKTRYAMYAEATMPAFARLASADVPVALLAGASLVSRYPQGTRLLNDLDFLIRRGDYAQVAAALQDCGFQRVLSKEVRALGKGEDYQLRTANRMSFVKHSPHTPLSLEVYWSLQKARLPFVVETHALLSRAVRVQFGDASMLALSPEDMLINYAAELIADHLSMNFLRLTDIHTVVSGGVSWTTLCDSALKAQAAGATHLVLSGAGLLGAEVPDDVLRKLEDECPGCGFGSSIVAEPRWLLDRFRLAGSARNVLTPLFLASSHDRVARIRSMPADTFKYSRRMGGNTWQSLTTSLGAILLAMLSGVAVLGLWIGSSLSLRALTRPLRRLLWRRDAGGTG